MEGGGRASRPALPSSALGLLRSSHRKAYHTALAGGCALFMLAAFPLMIGLAWVPDPSGWTLTAFGLALVLSGTPVVWHALVDRVTRIDLYTGGLMYHHRHTVAVIPWSAIISVKRQSDPLSYGLVLETISAGRIDLAGMHDGLRLTDAILRDTAHLRTTPTNNPDGWSVYQ